MSVDMKCYSLQWPNGYVSGKFKTANFGSKQD